MGTMSWSNVWSEISTRLYNSFGAQQVPEASWMVWVVVAVVVALVTTPAWTHIRQIVTVVHELGHAIVGIFCGRRFVGFVINNDMSGHAVTIGRTRGLGIVLTTLAGYPMPALVGAVMMVVAMAGRVQLVLLVGVTLLATALFRAKTWYTLMLLALLLVSSIALWWSENGVLAALIVWGVGMLLLAGAWRQFAAVVFRGGRSDDPGMLASLTFLPRTLWHLVILTMIAVPTWWATSAILVR